MIGKIRFNKLLGIVLTSTLGFFIALYIISVIGMKIGFSVKVKGSEKIVSIDYVENLKKGTLNDEQMSEYEDINYIVVLFLQDSHQSRKVFNTLNKIKEEDFELLVVDFRNKSQKEIAANGLMSPVHYLALTKEGKGYESIFNSFSNKHHTKIYEDLRYADRFGLPFQPFPETADVQVTRDTVFYSYTAVESKYIKKDDIVKFSIDMLSFTRDNSYSIDPGKFKLKDKVSGKIYNELKDEEYVNIISGGTSYAKTYTLDFEFPNDVLAVELLYGDEKDGLKMHLRVPYLETKQIPDKITYNVEFFTDGELLNTLTVKEGYPVEKLKALDLEDKNGYKFAGWYQDESFEKRFRFSNEHNPTLIEKNMKVYAKWEKTINLTIKVGTEMNDLYFVLDYGTTFNKSDIVIKNDDETLEIEGYYLDEEFTESWDIINDEFTEDITIYIKWKRKEA